MDAAAPARGRDHRAMPLSDRHRLQSLSARALLHARARAEVARKTSAPQPRQRVTRAVRVPWGCRPFFAWGCFRYFGWGRRHRREAGETPPVRHAFAASVNRGLNTLTIKTRHNLHCLNL